MPPGDLPNGSGASQEAIDLRLQSPKLGAGFYGGGGEEQATGGLCGRHELSQILRRLLEARGAGRSSVGNEPGSRVESHHPSTEDLEVFRQENPSPGRIAQRCRAGNGAVA